MNLDHLALVVTDKERSRDFYETFLGFDHGPVTHDEDGTLIIRNAHGFSLALHPVTQVPPMAEFSHFGFGVKDANEVRTIRARIEKAGFSVVDFTEEARYVSVKFLDPDGYKIEVTWAEVD